MITVEQWEEKVRQNGLTPVQRQSYKGVDIYIAVSSLQKPDDFYPEGHYYQVMYAVGLGGKLDIASLLAIDMAHDPSMDINGREKARIAAGMKAAREYIDLNLESGRYGSH
jgi:hypothetical protein